MDLTNIKRNQLDYLLTDVLPTELSDSFSYADFYEFLVDKDLIKDIIKQLQESKAKSMSLFADGSKWASMPLKYSIMKDLHTVREISLVQPMGALEMLFFVEVYQKEILNILEKNSCFSLRYHKKNNDLCYKKTNKSIINYFAEESKEAGREIIEQTGMYFNIMPFKSILTSSRS